MKKFAPPYERHGRTKIACVGEAMIELSFPKSESNNPEFGYAGDTLNTAIYLKREIKDRGEVSFLTILRTDPFSEQMITFIEGEDVKTNTIARDPDRLPGLYSIITDPTGERIFYYWRESSAARKLFQTPDGLDFSVMKGFDVIYFSAITLAILPSVVRQSFLDWIAYARANGDCLVAFDSNYRASLWNGPDVVRSWIEKAWRLTDIALPSADDEKAVFLDASIEETTERLRTYGLQTGALKNGSDGPIPLATVAALPEFGSAPKIVDTTAAGDSFNGAFLAAILTGQSIPEALLKGHLLAAKVVGFTGAFSKEDQLEIIE